LFYDQHGSSLYERITSLPEYYLTRVERSILEENADAIVAAVRRANTHPLHVVELGAGTATKSQILLDAVVRAQGHCLYVPIDVSRAPLEQATRRLAREAPCVVVRPIATSHERALGELRSTSSRRLVLFIGSSIGNYEDCDAVALLARVRAILAPGGALLLGTDWRKSPSVLLPAYDDAQGVTAAFNKNLLTRINRELGGSFDLDRFSHVARWNERESRIEMHLQSACEQVVRIRALELEVRFTRGETIHTESSIKYDMPRVDRLLVAANLVRQHTYFDREQHFAVHLARVPG
jgi:dimethylhistidine N-methyltransferase